MLLLSHQALCIRMYHSNSRTTVPCINSLPTPAVYAPAELALTGAWDSLAQSCQLTACTQQHTGTYHQSRRSSCFFHPTKRYACIYHSNSRTTIWYTPDTLYFTSMRQYVEYRVPAFARWLGRWEGRRWHAWQGADYFPPPRESQINQESGDGTCNFAS